VQPLPFSIHWMWQELDYKVHFLCMCRLCIIHIINIQFSYFYQARFWSWAFFTIGAGQHFGQFNHLWVVLIFPFSLTYWLCISWVICYYCCCCCCCHHRHIVIIIIIAWIMCCFGWVVDLVVVVVVANWLSKSLKSKKWSHPVAWVKTQGCF